MELLRDNPEKYYTFGEEIGRIAGYRLVAEQTRNTTLSKASEDDQKGISKLVILASLL